MNVVRFSAAILFTLFIFGKNLCAQSLRGVVHEAELNAGVFRPTVFLLEKNDTLAFVRADDNGFFELKSPKSGIFLLQIRAVGYETRILPEVELSKGKELVLEIFLKTTSETLQPIEIRAKNPDRQLQIGQTILTREAILRYPATFFDPARLAQTLPGVANDDQNNGISVYGLSPALFQYRIEGLEIVNPNHLSNAGTPSDLPTPSSGGVSMLSAQMLGNSSIYTSSTPVDLGNSVGGLMDIRLRPGNSDHFEATIQAGLIGLDASVEGPLSRKKTGSFLVNYRYSTIGILEKMGVQLGDEVVNFQDFSAHILQNIGKKQVLSAFFVGGNSSNYFAGKTDSMFTSAKDQYEIDFEQNTNIAGLIYKKTTRKTGFLTISLANSSAETYHFERQFITDFKSENRSFESKKSIRATFDSRFRKKIRIKIGGQITRKGANPSSTFGGTNVAQIFNSYNFAIRPMLNLDFGWQFVRASDIFKEILPSIGANLRLKSANFLQAKMEIVHQFSYFEGSYLIKKRFGGPRFTAGWRKNFGEKSNLLIECIAMKLNLFDADFLRDTTFSMFDKLGSVPRELNFTQNFQEIGYQMGLSAVFNQPFRDGKFIQINGSIFDVKQKNGDDKLISTRFNSRWTTNLTAGKDWQKLKSNGQKLRTLGISGSLRARGGFRESPIDLVASESFGKTFFVGNQYNSRQLPTYFRADLRLFWKKNYKNRTGTLALDIQNVTNRQNIAWHYYDVFLKKVVAKKGLGLIPILSYRLDFNFKKDR